MLPKSKRLSKEDFEGIRPKIFFRGQLVDVGYCIPTTNNSGEKFACVISKKTLKNAVDRNKAKRRVFEVLYEFMKENRIEKYFYVLYPKKTIHTVSYTDIKKEIYKAFATLQ